MKSKRVPDLIWHFVFSCFLSIKPCLRFPLVYFAREIEGFYLSSFGNEVDLTDLSPEHLGIKLKFQKTETQFCRWKSTDYKGINIFLSLGNPCTLCLQRKRPENAFLTVTVNYAIQNKKNWLFNDIWHYLFIACFDWKISDFQ